MSTDIETLKTRLAEAEAARHDLLRGVKAVDLQIGDSGSASTRVSYHQVDLGRLEAYIRELQMKIGESPRAVRSRRVMFG